MINSVWSQRSIDSDGGGRNSLAAGAIASACLPVDED